jgi:hypothetical protein
MLRIPKNNLAPDIKSLIDDVAIKIIFTYKNGKNRWKPDGTSHLLDDDYSYAPYEFQRIFKRRFEKYLTAEFKTPVRKQIPRHASFLSEDVNYINSYLDELIRAFPENMENLNETYQDWDDTVRISLDCDQDSFLKLVDDFWGIFSKHLRISYYENIPDAKISFWKSKLFSDDFPEYQNLLSSERKRLLKIWNSNFTPNPSTMDIVKKINRISFEDAIRES